MDSICNQIINDVLESDSPISTLETHPLWAHAPHSRRSLFFMRELGIRALNSDKVEVVIYFCQNFNSFPFHVGKTSASHHESFTVENLIKFELFYEGFVFKYINQLWINGRFKPEVIEYLVREQKPACAKYFSESRLVTQKELGIILATDKDFFQLAKPFSVEITSFPFDEYDIDMTPFSVAQLDYWSIMRNWDFYNSKFDFTKRLFSHPEDVHSFRYVKNVPISLEDLVDFFVQCFTNDEGRCSDAFVSAAATMGEMDTSRLYLKNESVLYSKTLLDNRRIIKKWMKKIKTTDDNDSDNDSD